MSGEKLGPQKLISEREKGGSRFLNSFSVYFTVKIHKVFTKRMANTVQPYLLKSSLFNNLLTNIHAKRGYVSNAEKQKKHLIAWPG
jgi:hypothetical protein